MKESEPVRSEKRPPLPPPSERYTSTTRRRPRTRTPALSFPAKRFPRPPVSFRWSHSHDRSRRIPASLPCTVAPFSSAFRSSGVGFPHRNSSPLFGGEGGKYLKSCNGTFTLRQRVENADRAEKKTVGLNFATIPDTPAAAELSVRS